MSLPTSESITAVFIVVTVGWRLRGGYLRRRPHWDRTSWHRFAMTLTVIGLALVGLALMAKTVDAGLYTQIGASRTFRGLWVTAMVVLLLGAVSAGVIVVNWFAMGDPERPCPSPFRFSQWFDRRSTT
jgi:hypothetical protein